MTKEINTIKRKRQYLFNIVVAALIIGFVVGFAFSNNNIQNFLGGNKVTTSKSDPVLVNSGEIDLCFTPPSGCGKVIAGLISKANKSIYVQAYGITSEEIARELIAAHKRGVKVRILLDKSNLHDKYSRMKEMQDAGIEVSIDKVSGIAHNKVIIIDLRLLVTGSYNFTKSAESRNTENIIIVNDKQIAERYLQNWLSRKSKNNHLTKEN
jgi:phospholipase D